MMGYAMTSQTTNIATLTLETAAKKIRFSTIALNVDVKLNWEFVRDSKLSEIICATISQIPRNACMMAGTVIF